MKIDDDAEVNEAGDSGATLFHVTANTCFRKDNELKFFVFLCLCGERNCK